MTSTRFVRGSNSRMLAYLSGLLLFTATIFLYHNARVEVDAEKEALAKCQQAQESLSAQLQVIFEYKVRLEKNLNEERNKHQETKDKLQAHLSDEQEKNKENKEAANKFTALQQQYRLLQTQNEDLRGECDKAKTTCKAQLKSVEQKAATDIDKLKSRNMQVKEEADDYRRQLVDLQNESKKTDGQSDRYKKDNIQLRKENENLKDQIEKLERRVKGLSSSTDREGAAGPDGGRRGGPNGPDAGALAAPHQGRPHAPSSSTATPDGRQGMNDVIANQLAASNSKALGKQPTTPQINPDALLSQEKAAAARAGVGAGVGAAPPAAPVAPAPPSLSSGSSQGPGPKHSPQQVLKSKDSFQEAQQQQEGVLPVPFAFQDNQGLAPGPAVVPALAPPALAPPAQAPPQQHVAQQSHEVPSNQGQQPPLDEGAYANGGFANGGFANGGFANGGFANGGFNNGFNAALAVPRNFAAQREHEDWIAAFHRPMENQRREPVAAPVDAREHEDRQRERAELARREREREGEGDAPFRGVDYDKELHAGENEEDDDDDADQMDSHVVRAPEIKKFGANKFFGRNNIMPNPR